MGYVPRPPKEKKRKKKTVKENQDDDEIGTCDNSASTFLESIGPEYVPAVHEALKQMNEAEIPLELIECLLADIQEKGAPGAVLIFLPGWNVISTMLGKLEDHPIFGDQSKCLVLPLHSQLTSKDQHRVFNPVSPGIRKIILSTNIAETSITINDVVYVIDSCR